MVKKLDKAQLDKYKAHKKYADAYDDVLKKEKAMFEYTSGAFFTVSEYFLNASFIFLYDSDTSLDFLSICDCSTLSPDVYSNIAFSFFNTSS